MSDWRSTWNFWTDARHRSGSFASAATGPWFSALSGCGLLSVPAICARNSGSSLPAPCFGRPSPGDSGVARGVGPRVAPTGSGPNATAF
eukprot:8662717-Pyramimonas_sp.AAC.1